MKEKLIILKGEENTGKSSILNRLFEMLIEQNIDKNIEIRGQNTHSFDKQIFIEFSGEKSAVSEESKSFVGKFVVICTGGDNITAVRNQRKIFRDIAKNLFAKNYKKIIYVSASRDEQKFIDALKEFSSERKIEFKEIQSCASTYENENLLYKQSRCICEIYEEIKAF